MPSCVVVGIALVPKCEHFTILCRILEVGTETPELNLNHHGTILLWESNCGGRVATSDVCCICYTEVDLVPIEEVKPRQKVQSVVSVFLFLIKISTFQEVGLILQLRVHRKKAKSKIDCTEGTN